ncbi:16S rRNA (guanine(966)-N(2))-methyltransferase RsmD [Tannockella kyphosi]|uniref:16S rRNA (guanine(966)-N(2))-methyltransferase RsmD n=1 Tax=Tannockella kyphosi TaxID=2899121 RepID=UPI0020111CA6|nr:16S rRNA (guanine(966)-N(2))-methyltransferase RsmD [Tannockella kyphosi]
MRVIAGTYKSRTLKTVKSNSTRPTTDRNKENLFNIIGPYFDGGCVLDLFGGSGGLGIEAMSRGCTKLISVDSNLEAFKVIKENVATLKIENANVYKMDYKKALEKFKNENQQFQYVFLDPPYGKEMANYTLSYLVEHNLLENDAIIVVEEIKEAILPQINQLECIKEVNYGITALHIYRYKGE